MVEDLLQQLVDRLDHRYFGKYRGYVHRVDDPLKLGRIQVIVPRLLGDVPTGWAMPCTPYAGPDQGLFTVPDPGTGVWVEFEGGDLSRPIWSGMWWGSPDPEDVGQPDSTAATFRATPEVPRHNYPAETAVPGVRILKSATGHHIVLDDREGHERIEIHDSRGNRIILSKDGIETLVSNERTVNEGNRGTQIDQNDFTEVGGDQVETISGDHARTVGGDAALRIEGHLDETVGGNAYQRTVDHRGLTVRVEGPRTDTINGAHHRKVTGAAQDTIVGGYGLSAGGSIHVASGGSISLKAGAPSPPLGQAISLDAPAGMISINTMAGALQLGGLTAISPLVVGDGLAIHLTMLVQILKTINPMTVAAYGPMLDAWTAMIPLMDFSYFAFVKRFPVG